MKKIFTLFALSLATLFVFTGCTVPIIPITLKANWYTDNAQENLKYIKETIVYDISVDDSKLDNDIIKLDKDTFKGSLTLNLTVEDGNYLLTSTQKMSGKYIAGAVEFPFTDDLVVSKVYFKSIKNVLYPVKSTKHYKGNTPYRDGSKIEFYEYEYQTIYGENESEGLKDGEAKVKLLKHSENFVNHKDEYVISKLAKKQNYYDNEQLLFLPRAMTLAAQFTQSVSTISLVDEKLQIMKYSIAKEDANKSFNLKDLGVSYNDAVYAEDFNINTIKVTIALSSKMSGATTTCYYSVPSDTNKGYNQRLIKMESPLPYKLGELVYTIKNIQYSETQEV